MIEEAFVLGHYEELEIAASILRGFNCRLTIVFQSYSQIIRLYPQTHGLFTAGAIMSFRPADLDTAEWLVKRAGKEILPVLSSADPASPTDFGARESWQQQQRDRIPLDTMFGMPRGRALIWLPHEEQPRDAWIKGYYDIPELARRAGVNPYYRR
jgi:type IV secretory pathway TraG/TraD family ATPase VirD4